MAWLCNASVWSKCSTCQDVCKPCRGKGITKYRAAECHLFLCVKLGENATTTHGQRQQAFGHHAMSREQAFRLHDMISEGRTLVEDGQRSGRPTTRIGDNAARVREHVRSERRLSQNHSRWSEHTWETVHLIKTVGDEKNVCQDGAQESHRVTAGCVVEPLS
jgi:hypothetical protein